MHLQFATWMEIKYENITYLRFFIIFRTSNVAIFVRIEDVFLYFKEWGSFRQCKNILIVRIVPNNDLASIPRDRWISLRIFLDVIKWIRKRVRNSKITLVWNLNTKTAWNFLRSICEKNFLTRNNRGEATKFVNKLHIVSNDNKLGFQPFRCAIIFLMLNFNVYFSLNSLLSKLSKHLRKLFNISPV